MIHAANASQEILASIDAKHIGRILQATGRPPETVYQPSEDSFLMLEAISNICLNGIEVCDLGTGSGILGLFCASRGAIVTVTDVYELALRHTVDAAKRLRIEVKPILSDMFSNVNGTFSLILFNPPYLATEGHSDRAVDGGMNGLVLTNRFLKELPHHLKPEGSGLLLLSSLNNPRAVINEHPEFSFSVLARRSLFFEELQVLRLRLRENLSSK